MRTPVSPGPRCVAAHLQDGGIRTHVDAAACNTPQEPYACQAPGVRCAPYDGRLRFPMRVSEAGTRVAEGFHAHTAGAGFLCDAGARQRRLLRNRDQVILKSPHWWVVLAPKRQAHHRRFGANTPKPPLRWEARAVRFRDEPRVPRTPCAARACKQSRTGPKLGQGFLSEQTGRRGHCLERTPRTGIGDVGRRQPDNKTLHPSLPGEVGAASGRRSRSRAGTPSRRRRRRESRGWRGRPRRPGCCNANHDC